MEKEIDIEEIDIQEYGSSTYDIPLGYFNDLPQEMKNKIIRMIARIMERAYRRGVQQALHMNNKDRIDEWIIDDEGYSLRYEKSLNVCIGLDGFITTSIERLDIEEKLGSVGLKFK